MVLSSSRDQDLASHLLVRNRPSDTPTMWLPYSSEIACEKEESLHIRLEGDYFVQIGPHSVNDPLLILLQQFL